MLNPPFVSQDKDIRCGGLEKKPISWKKIPKLSDGECDDSSGQVIGEERQSFI